MTTYTLKLKGSNSSHLKARVFALKFYSSLKIISGFAYVRWICETERIKDVMKYINISELERLGINIKFFG